MTGRSLFNVILVCVFTAVPMFMGCGAYRMGSVTTPFSDTPPMSGDELAVSAKKAVRDYYEAHQFDSAVEVMKYWTDQTGVSRTTYRTSLLMHIAAGTFEDDLYDKWIIEIILAYKNMNRYGLQYSSWYDAGSGEALDEFNRRVARELKKTRPQGSVEYLLCECFSGDCDSVFEKLQTPAYEGSRLRYYYDREIDDILSDRKEANFAVYGGAWVPQGSAEALGTHPILGMVLGGQGHKMLYNFAAEWRMGNASDPYVVDHKGVVDTTARFAGYYAGFELGRELFRSIQHQFFARVGAGLDGFGYDPSAEDRPKEKVNSYNINIGLAYRYYLGWHDLNYVGLEGVYNFIAYENDGGDGLTGNALGFRFLVGWGGNQIYNNRLRDLQYGR